MQFGESIGKAVGEFYSMIIRLEEKWEFDLESFASIFVRCSFLDITNLCPSTLPFAILSQFSIANFHALSVQAFSFFKSRYGEWSFSFYAFYYEVEPCIASRWISLWIKRYSEGVVADQVDLSQTAWLKVAAESDASHFDDFTDGDGCLFFSMRLDYGFDLGHSRHQS